MASSLSSLDCFKCSVCMESMLGKRPLALSCLHTFCTPCGKRLYQGSPLVCPTCRSETVVPDDDVGKLPINRDLIKIMEQLEGSKMSTGKAEPPCETCIRKGNHHQSVGMCVQCVRKLCQLCIDKHKQIAAFQSHQIVTSVVKSEEQEENVCVTHGEVMQYMCIECLVPLCIDCTNEDSHEEHLDKVQPLEKGIAELRAEYKDMATKVNKYIKGLETIKKEVTSSSGMLDASMKELNELRESFQKKIEEIDTVVHSVSLCRVPMRQVDEEIRQMIDHARHQQNIMKSAEKCSDLKFLSQRRNTPSNIDYAHQTEAIRKKVHLLKVPNMGMNKHFANTIFACIPIGKMEELSPDNCFRRCTDCRLYTSFKNCNCCSSCKEPFCESCRQKHICLYEFL